MLPALLAAVLLGIVAGLRTFTPPAVLWLVRHGGPWAIVLWVAAALEYAGDLHPSAPARTQAAGLIPRVLSGAFCGWQLVAASGGSGAAGAIAGGAAAVAGAYGGLALRARASAAIGNVPSGLLEDAVAIGAAFAIVAHA